MNDDRQPQVPGHPPTEPDPPPAQPQAAPPGPQQGPDRSADSAVSAASPWPRVVLWVLVVAMVLASGLYVFRTLVRMPGDAVRAGGRLGSQMLADLAEVAAAFEEGEIETRFVSYAASMTGTTFLQFATLDQTEVYTRSDSSSVLWGRFALPDVVVAATAPVEYTYYLDLEGDWSFELEDDRITVYTPEIRYNRPSIDASEIHFDVRESSVFRDEEMAIEELKKSLTTLSEGRAAEHIPLVRELGRKKTEQFVGTWFAAQFGDGEDFRIEVIFPDEPGGRPSPPRVEPLAGSSHSG